MSPKAMAEDKRARWRRLHPWARFVEYARRRCNDKMSKWYDFYGAKGITCSLTAKDLELIWKRDGAESMRKPSIDRIDPKKSYTVDNVRFIEFKLNARIAWDPKSKPL